jgi:hypothetical protein
MSCQVTGGLSLIGNVSAGRSLGVASCRHFSGTSNARGTLVTVFVLKASQLTNIGREGKFRRKILESDLITHWMIGGMTQPQFDHLSVPFRPNPRNKQPNRFQFDIIYAREAKPFDYKLIKQIAN